MFGDKGLQIMIYKNSQLGKQKYRVEVHMLSFLGDCNTYFFNQNLSSCGSFLTSDVLFV